MKHTIKLTRNLFKFQKRFYQGNRYAEGYDSNFPNYYNLNKYSSEITQKKERGAAQAMLYSLGLTKDDMNKAQIGVVSMWYSGNPCNSKLNIFSDIISKSIKTRYMLPMQFNTI